MEKIIFSNQWNSETKNGMGQLDKYDTFEDLGKYPPEPVAHNNIHIHLVYDAKHDETHREKLATDGHLTDIPVKSVYCVVFL